MSLAISSCRLEPAAPPSASRPFIHDGKMLFQGENFLVKGTLQMGPPPASAGLREFLLPRLLSSPIGMGWRAGWIQLCCQEEVWGLYRGATPTDGTLMARWPSSESFDTESQDNREFFVKYNGKFYKELSSGSPTALLEFKDAPQHYFPPSLMNSITLKPNVLAVAVVRMSFILALAARDPEDHLHVLKSMFWWLRWESTFKGPAAALQETRVDSRTEAGQSNPEDAAPPKLMQALKSGASHKSSNVLAQDSEEKSYARWQDLAHIRPLPR
jgi:hypothetical protein